MLGWYKSFGDFMAFVFSISALSKKKLRWVAFAIAFGLSLNFDLSDLIDLISKPLALSYRFQQLKALRQLISNTDKNLNITVFIYLINLRFETL